MRFCFCCLFLNKPLEREWIGKTQPLNYCPGLFIRFDVPQWFISHKLLTQQWGKQTDKKKRLAEGKKKKREGGWWTKALISLNGECKSTHSNNKMHG